MLNLSIYLSLAMDLPSHVKMMFLDKYSLAVSVPISVKILTIQFPLRLTGLFPVTHRAKLVLVSSMDL